VASHKGLTIPAQASKGTCKLKKDEEIVDGGVVGTTALLEWTLKWPEKAMQHTLTATLAPPEHSCSTGSGHARPAGEALLPRWPRDTKSEESPSPDAPLMALPSQAKGAPRFARWRALPSLLARRPLPLWLRRLRTRFSHVRLTAHYCCAGATTTRRR